MPYVINKIRIAHRIPHSAFRIPHSTSSIEHSAPCPVRIYLYACMVHGALDLRCMYMQRKHNMYIYTAINLEYNKKSTNTPTQTSYKAPTIRYALYNARCNHVLFFQCFHCNLSFHLKSILHYVDSQ